MRLDLELCPLNHPKIFYKKFIYYFAKFYDKVIYNSKDIIKVYPASSTYIHHGVTIFEVD